MEIKVKMCTHASLMNFLGCITAKEISTHFKERCDFLTKLKVLRIEIKRNQPVNNNSRRENVVEIKMRESLRLAKYNIWAVERIGVRNLFSFFRILYPKNTLNVPDLEQVSYWCAAHSIVHSRSLILLPNGYLQ
jgi:hypothetical protein